MKGNKYSSYQSREKRIIDHLFNRFFSGKEQFIPDINFFIFQVINYQ